MTPITDICLLTSSKYLSQILLIFAEMCGSYAIITNCPWDVMPCPVVDRCSKVDVLAVQWDQRNCHEQGHWREK